MFLFEWNLLFTLTIYSSLEASTKLQKTILSASFLKHPSFCCELIKRYIKFTDQLSNEIAKSHQPIVVTLFQANDFDMSTIDENCTFKLIEITSVKSQTNLLVSNVKLLTHIITEITDLQNDLTVECALCILNTFNNAHLRVKSRCLRFFSKLLNHSLNLDTSLQSMLVSILDSIEYFEKVIPLWIHHKLVKPDEIESFTSLVNDFVENQSITKLFDVEHLKQAINSCLNILRTHSHLNVDAYEKIMPGIYKFMRTISVYVNDFSLHEKIYQFVAGSVEDDQLFRKNITLLGPILLDEMKNFKINSWHLAEKKIAVIQNEQNQTNGIIIEQLKCLCSILRTARFLEHSITCDLQRQRYNDIHKVNENGRELLSSLRSVFKSHISKLPRRLFTSLNDLSKFILNQFTALLTTKYSPLIDTSTLLLFSEITTLMLGLSDSQDMDDYLQHQLVLITLCPFIRCSELLLNHLQQAFEEETNRINKIMESPFIADDANAAWQELALQSIANINLEYVLTNNKEIFMDILCQIVGNINQPEYLDHIFNVLISCVIQAETYGIRDYEKFIEKVSRDQRNELVVSHHLKNFYCLSSGQTIIMQTNKGDNYRYKFICPICSSNKQINDEDAKSLRNLLDKTKNGRFVRIFKTLHTVQTEHQEKYFKMFVSDELKIRENMTFCLPAILNHLNLGNYHNVTDYWLSPIVDKEMNIRLWMIKYIHMIPKHGDERILNKCFEKLLECTRQFLMSDQKQDQSSVLSLISSFATSAEITEPMLLNCFRLTLYFCICSKSMVSRQAALCATEMCFKFGITPKNILIWYKTELFKFIISICVSNYITYDVAMQKSLHSVSSLSSLNKSNRKTNNIFNFFIFSII